MQRLNDTKEKGWGSLEPGDRIGALYELEIGKLYLKETCRRVDGFSYNVVEILPVPEGFLYIPGQELLYGCYVDPLDTSKPRRYNNGIFSIWWWEISKANDDAYYRLAARPAEPNQLTSNDDNQTRDPETSDPATRTEGNLQGLR